MDKEVLEAVLKRYDRESKLEKVLEMEVKPFLPKGENYSSKIMQIRLKVVLANGRIAKKSLIAKMPHVQDKLGEYFKQNAVSLVEPGVFTNVLKEMKHLMEEYEDTEETIWCELIHFDPVSSSMFLEDLKSVGYKLVPRQQGLDLEHSLLALRALGRYHGMSKVLEQRGIISKDNCRPFSMITDRVLIKWWLYSGIQNTSRAMKQYWGPQWKEVAEKLGNLEFEAFADKLISLAKPLDSDFTVLNHGDCWSNNMMFKYDWRNRPISVKFLDFQLPHYNSSSLDIIYFLHFGVQPHVRRQNYQILLKTYHDSLVSTLNKFGYNGIKPTFEEISSMTDRVTFFGLATFICGYAVITCSSTNAMDTEKMVQGAGIEAFNPKVLAEPGMEEKMGPDIADFVRKYLPL